MDLEELKSIKFVDKRMLVDHHNEQFFAHADCPHLAFERELGDGCFLLIIVDDYFVGACSDQSNNIGVSKHLSQSDTTRKFDLRVLHKRERGMDLQRRNGAGETDALGGVEGDAV